MEIDGDIRSWNTERSCEGVREIEIEIEYECECERECDCECKCECTCEFEESVSAHM